MDCKMDVCDLYLECSRSVQLLRINTDVSMIS